MMLQVQTSWLHDRAIVLSSAADELRSVAGDATAAWRTIAAAAAADPVAAAASAATYRWLEAVDLMAGAAAGLGDAVREAASCYDRADRAAASWGPVP